MLDARFYRLTGPVRADALAGPEGVRGDGARMIAGVAALAEAGPGDLAYFEGSGDIPLTQAGALIAPLRLAEAAYPGALLPAAQPRAHFSRVAARLAQERTLDQDEAISPAAEIEPDAKIRPGAVIGADAKIGAGATIGANAVIGPGVAIGRRTRIGANVTIACALIGDDVTILPGAAIGQPGFGVASDAGGRVDVPHFGRVIIQDGVTIGACSAVDRGMFGDTLIAEGAKIDNLCHVGHNVTVGRDVLMAAFGGLSGSTEIGDGVMMGGRVGVADHLRVGAGAVLAAGSAVLQDVPRGEVWGGYPAKALRRWLREVAWLARTVEKRHGGKH